MTLQEYVNQYVTTPGTKVGDGQCVSEAKNVLSLVFSINLGAIGNAVDYTNPTNQAKFASVGLTWHAGLTDFVDGDMLVWGDDPGTFTGPYGHIAHWYQGKLLNQNNNNREYVTLDNFFKPGYLGLYRKVEMAIITIEAVVAESIATTGKQPSNDEEKFYIGKEATQENLDGFITYWAGKSTIPQLNEQITELEAGGTVLEPGKYSVR